MKYLRKPVFLGMMPQALHIWIWGCSDNLLCRASSILSGWMGANGGQTCLFRCLLVSVKDTGAFLQQVSYQDLFPDCSVWLDGQLSYISLLLLGVMLLCSITPVEIIHSPNPIFLLFFFPLSPVILIHQFLLADLIMSPEAKMAGGVISL